MLNRSKHIFILLLLCGGLFWNYSGAFHSFFREDKAIRFYVNPASTIFAVTKTAVRSVTDGKKMVVSYGTDTMIDPNDTHRELVIMVVGETVRADHFSLNGYSRQTNPLLEQQDLVSFTNVRSCATSTNISVPCMFSHLSMDAYNTETARYTENALDILHRAGVNVLWRDNNSSSKNVADRLPYEDFRTAEKNPICDEECRDVGMLDGLQDYINQQKQGDIIIVLHAMGNHGPAYYKRYPKAFERFTPACQTNELSECGTQEIANAYDNAILYTDYFLNEVIELLKQNDNTFKTMMFYVGDHGESLGKNGMYLHGMPNFIAPEAQRHVPLMVWLGAGYDEASIDTLREKKDRPVTHDSVFHSLLGTFEVLSAAYDPQLDIIHDSRVIINSASNNTPLRKTME